MCLASKLTVIKQQLLNAKIERNDAHFLAPDQRSLAISKTSKKMRENMRFPNFGYPIQTLSGRSLCASGITQAKDA